MPDEKSGQTSPASQATPAASTDSTPAPFNPGSDPTPPNSGSLVDQFLRGDLTKETEESQPSSPDRTIDQSPEDLSELEITEQPAATAQSPSRTSDRPSAKQPEVRRDANGKPIPVARDYSGLSAPEVAMFKQMDGQAFKTLKPIFLEHKELKAKVGKMEAEHKTALETAVADARKERYFDIDGAWQLDPEVQQLDFRMKTINAEADHWKQQMVNIRQGKPVIPLVADEKGEPCLGTPIEVSDANSAQLEAEIINNLHQAASIRDRVSNDYNAATSTYKQRFAGFYDEVNKIREHIFGPHKEVLAKRRDHYLNLMPAPLRGRPTENALAEALSVMEQQVKVIKSLKAQLKGHEVNSGARKGSVVEEHLIQGGNGNGGSEDPDEIRKQFAKKYRI